MLKISKLQFAPTASLAHTPFKMQKNVGTEGETEARVSTPYVSSVTLRSVTYTSLQLEICICTDRAEGNWSELQLAADAARRGQTLLGCFITHTTFLVVLIVLMR